METLDRWLNNFETSLLGVGHMLGAATYLLTCTVAKDMAGPEITLSFLFVSLASLLSTSGHAELSARVPKPGSVNVFKYISMVEFWSFVIGWNILLEHMSGETSVAPARSGYVDSLFDGIISNATISTTYEMSEQLLGLYLNCLACSVCIVGVSFLGIGVKGSAIFDYFLTIISLIVIAIIIFLDFFYKNKENGTTS